MIGSLAHATWNLLVKRSGRSGVEFVWLYSALLAPLQVIAVVACVVHDVPTTGWWAGLVSAALHTGYGVALQRAYAQGSLGVVYPVARGAAPVLVLLASAAAVGSWPGSWAWFGAGLVAVGVVALCRPSGTATFRRSGRAVAAGGVVAVATASYTLWDSYAVTELGVDVLLYLVVAGCAQLVVLTAVVAPRGRTLSALASSSWRAALPIALLVPASYALVLVAMQTLDVAVVGAARCLAVVFGTLLAAVVLGERFGRRGVLGTVFVTGGIAVLAVA